MKFTDKLYEIEEATSLNLSANGMLDNLDVNPLVGIQDKGDREFFRSDMGKEAMDRVSTRDSWRSSWIGQRFFREQNRQMNDNEVDANIIHYFNLDPKEDINFGDIKERLRKERDLYYSGDIDKLTGAEAFNATAAAFGEYFENISKTTLEKQIALMATGGLPTFGTGGTAFGLPSAMSLTPEQAAEAKLKIDEMIDFLGPEAKDNLAELRAKAGDEDANWFVSSLAATASNLPNLVMGVAGAFGKGGWLVAAGGMYSQEYQMTKGEFFELFGIDKGSTAEDFKDNPILLEKFQRADFYAKQYAFASTIVEYISTPFKLKGAGVAKKFRLNTIPELFKRKETREYVVGVFDHIKKVTGMAVGNVAEEVTQQGLFNIIYNLAVDDATDNFDLDVSDKKVAFTQDLIASGRGGLQLSTILAIPGTVMNVTRARSYIGKKTQELKDLGFTSDEAYTFARDLAKAVKTPKKFEEVAERIRTLVRAKEGNKVIIEKEKQTLKLEKQSGVKTLDGNIFTNMDFDRLAIMFNEQELRDMIENKEHEDTFVNAVNGDMDARKTYNSLITVIDQVKNKKGKKKSKLKEVTPDVEKLINAIENGQFDSRLNLEEGETIEQAREKEINRILKEKGYGPRETKTEETTEETTEEAMMM